MCGKCGEWRPLGEGKGGRKGVGRGMVSQPEGTEGGSIGKGRGGHKGYPGESEDVEGDRV